MNLGLLWAPGPAAGNRAVRLFLCSLFLPSDVIVFVSQEPGRTGGRHENAAAAAAVSLIPASLVQMPRW